MRLSYLSFLLTVLLLANLPLRAQDSKRTRFLFVVDCSGSMYGDMGGKRRMVVAKEILTRLVDSMKNMPDVDMALRAFGHTSPHGEKDCHDTRLEVPFLGGNAESIKKKINTLQPNGATPIAYTLTQAAEDFPNLTGRNIIILITDGIEECGGDPCAVSKALQERHVILRPFIIGLGMNVDYGKYFDCVGRFFPAKTEGDLRDILSTVVTQAMNNTTVQVDLNNIDHKPTETNVNMSFTNAKSGLVMYDYYHTMNKAGVPDTFTLDPLMTYNLKVHTIPPVYKENITLKTAAHNIITLDAPQGSLLLGMTPIENQQIQCLVRQNNHEEIINVQNFNTTVKYLVGSYDLEVLTLPKMEFKDSKIEQSKTSRIEIQQAGKLELSYPKDIIGSLYILRNNKQEWVFNLNTYNSGRKEILYPQPGQYKVVYRNKGSVKTLESRDKDFRINSGTTTTITLD